MVNKLDSNEAYLKLSRGDIHSLCDLVPAWLKYVSGCHMWAISSFSTCGDHFELRKWYESIWIWKVFVESHQPVIDVFRAIFK